MPSADTKSRETTSKTGRGGADGADRSKPELSDTARDALGGASRASKAAEPRPDPVGSQERMAARAGPAKARVNTEMAAIGAPTDQARKAGGPASLEALGLSAAVPAAEPAVMTGAVPDATFIDSPGAMAQDACFCPATSGLPNPERTDLPPPPPIADFNAAVEQAGLPGLELTDGLREAAAHIGVDLATPRGVAAARAYEFTAGATADLMGARAFQSATGLPFEPENVVEGGVHRNALLETIAQMEYDAPGTFFNSGATPRESYQIMGQAYGPAVAATIEAVDRGYLSPDAGALIGEGLSVERRGIFPELSTTSSGARTAAQASGAPLPQNWQAHHKIPYATLLSLPFETQLAIAESGWRLDSPENVVPLPADEPSYTAPPNNGHWPMHSGPHPNYSAMVYADLLPLSDGVLMGDVSNWSIRQQLFNIGNTAIGATFNAVPGADHPFHMRLN